MAMATYWHGSYGELVEGCVLTPASNPGLSGHLGVEALLECVRPIHALSRKDAVFMAGTPDDIDALGGGTDWIAAVECTGTVTSHDAAWLSAIQCAMDDTQDDLARIEAMGTAYWLGERYPGPSSVFEYMSTEATVIQAWGEDDELDENFAVVRNNVHQPR